MSNTIAYLGGIIALQVAAAFFSAAETSMTTASRARLHQLSQEGNWRARVAYSLYQNKENLLGAILVGNNLCNTASAALATALLISVFGGNSELGALAATAVMTVAILIFSELLPKTYAIHHASQTAMLLAPLMNLCMWLLRPFTWAIVTIVRGILFVLGAESSGVSMSRHIEELKGAIDMHRGEDSDVAEERAMLRSILDLSDVEVKSIMVHRRQIDALDAALPVPELIEEALKTGFTRIPLWKGDPDNIIGILHIKALLREIRRVGSEVEKIDIAKVASRPWFIPESTNLLEQLQAFRTRREHFALVVDEYGGLRGIVTLEDVLEEIVGDIGDETDTGMPGVIRQPNGSYLVEGTVTVRELNREYEWKLPESDAATIAGLVLYESQRVPDVGQVFEFHGLRFEILRRQRNQITQLRIWQLNQTAEESPA